MTKIEIEETELEGLKIIKPLFVEDNRGYFLKAYEKNIFKENGIDSDVTETFESFSKKGVVRGLHYQEGDLAQAKLVRVLEGVVYDVCVDIRPESVTFGKWYGAYLSGINHKALYMEKGFAHGFLVTSETALMSYTCSGKHHSGMENGIKYDDEDLNIHWPLDPSVEIIQSERDRKLQSFAEYMNRNKRG